ncbi:hypothetical protein D9758_014098 [Tetrapyrgos nigripes]|uniref:F-box domain-containing protein n=1 Tax=Tetrapyrgos nigripes TaxID=182062 RepID=A0A8H5FJF7_9AGAR|nr:hypothetical protein D9758_014098 [Tetrapyrgos nigripes]
MSRLLLSTPFTSFPNITPAHEILPMDTVEQDKNVTAISQLPTELLLLIMQDFIGLSDTLKNCSLVCRSWSYPAQRHLFVSLLLQSSESCHRMNDLFKNAPHLGLHVNNLTLSNNGAHRSCGNIYTLDIDVEDTEWHTSGQDLVITKLKSVRNLTVKGRMSWDDLGELLYELPLLRSVRILPKQQQQSSEPILATPNHDDHPSPSGTLYFTSPFRLESLVLSGIEVPGHESFLEFVNFSDALDFSEMRSLKLGWLSHPPAAREFGEQAGITPLFEEFFPSPRPTSVPAPRRLFECPAFGKFAETLGLLTNLRELKLQLASELTIPDPGMGMGMGMGMSAGVLQATPMLIALLVVYGIRYPDTSRTTPISPTRNGAQMQLETLKLEIDLELTIPSPSPSPHLTRIRAHVHNAICTSACPAF